MKVVGIYNIKSDVGKTAAAVNLLYLRTYEQIITFIEEKHLLCHIQMLFGCFGSFLIVRLRAY